jgi:hypothetical protein
MAQMNAYELIHRAHAILEHATTWRAGLPYAWFSELRLIKIQALPALVVPEFEFLGTIPTCSRPGGRHQYTFQKSVTPLQVREYAYCFSALAYAVEYSFLRSAQELAQRALVDKSKATTEAARNAMAVAMSPTGCSPLSLLLKSPEAPVTRDELSRRKRLIKGYGSLEMVTSMSDVDLDDASKLSRRPVDIADEAKHG